MMVRLSNAFTLVALVLLCSGVSAQRYLRSTAPLNDINIDVKGEDNSRHGHGGNEEAERLKRQAPTRLDDINIKVDAADNSHHGTGAGHDGGEEAQRLKRHEPLSDINIGVNATDNSKHGGGHPVPRGPGPVVPSNPTGGDGNEEPISEGVGNDGSAIGKGAVQTESQRLKHQAERFDDINIDVKAVDNSHHGAGGSGGEEAERLKRHADSLNAINIGVNATDNSKHGDGHGQKSGGHQPSVPVEQPEPEAPAGDEAERLKRQAPLNAINIGVNATDNSKHGGGRKGGHPVPRGPGPVKPSKPTGDAGSEEGPGGSSETEGPDGHDGAGHDGACNGSNNNNNNNNNGNSNNNNNNNNNCKGGNNNNNNNNNRLKRQVLARLDDINVKVDAVDNSRHGAAGAGERGGSISDHEEPESEDADRLARRG